MFGFGGRQPPSPEGFGGRQPPKPLSPGFGVRGVWVWGPVGLGGGSPPARRGLGDGSPEGFGGRQPPNPEGSSVICAVWSVRAIELRSAGLCGCPTQFPSARRGR